MIDHGGTPSGRFAGRRWTVTAVHAGGLLGPLGGGLVSPMLPQIGESLHVTTSAAAASLTAYFIPFAAVQLVSGTLGERWGRRRTVRAAYLGYAMAAAACGLTWDLPVFLVLRATMGAANAFTSPLLLAGLADLVPPARLSRSVGVFASAQAAGQSFAPLIGGLATISSWRYAFFVTAVVALALATVPPPGDPRPGASAPPWRPLFSIRTMTLATVGFVCYAGASGLTFLVALHGEEHLHLTAATAGATLIGFGVAGLLLGVVWGNVSERYGPRRSGAVATVLATIAMAAVGTAGNAVALTAWWTAAGAMVALMTVALQNLTVRAVPGNRGGALSVVSAFRFTGAAIAPTIWLPVYHHDATLTFALAGATMLLAVPAFALHNHSRRDS
jgi:MFS family permease